MNKSPDEIVLRSPIGLIAGSGQFPLEFIEEAQRRGLQVVVVAHYDETEQAIASRAHVLNWIRIGQLGKAIRTFKKHGVSQVAFVGGITKTRFFRRFRPDFVALKVLSRVVTGHDDAVLGAIAAEFEHQGLQIFSPVLLLTKSIAHAGMLTVRNLSATERHSAAVGWKAATTLGELDIGQGVVVSRGIVVAVEAVEGTDALVARAGVLSGAGVLVKRSKPQQDLRLDMPSIGPKTIEQIAAAGLTALVIEAERTLILDPQETIRRANHAKLAVIACRSVEELLDEGTTVASHLGLRSKNG